MMSNEPCYDEALGVCVAMSSSISFSNHYDEELGFSCV